MERHSIIEAYSKLLELPEEATRGTRCLLDRNGVLHPLSDIDSERYVIDDDPQLAKAAAEQGAEVAFADTSDIRVLPFYAAIELRRLTEVCELKAIKAGKELPFPYHLNLSRILDRIHHPEFASCLGTLIAYELQNHSKPLPSSLQLGRRLATLREISCADEIQATYLIAGSLVSVQRKHNIEGERIILALPNRRSEVRGLIANAISELITNIPSDRIKLVDSIYRLLGCASTRERGEYLESRGISWRTPRRSIGESEDMFEEEEDFLTDDYVVREMISNSLREASFDEYDVTEPSEGTESLEEELPCEETTPTISRSLPPINSVTLTIIEPSDEWSPPIPEGRGRTRPTDWVPPDVGNEEWEREVGRRGEEKIYLREIARVRAIGYPESEVVWEADKNPGARYDIKSVDADGQDIWIEVKSTTGRDGRFRWPKTEFELALQKRERYILWRVYEAHTINPSAKPFRDPIGILLKNRMRLDIANLFAMVEPL